MLRLMTPTDPSWVEVDESQLDVLLQDHAQCELKAAHTALSLLGRFAAELAAKGDSSASVIIRRVSNAPYASEFARADLAAVARRTRHVPTEFIAGSNDVSAAFYAYCRPLLGDLPKLERL